MKGVILNQQKQSEVREKLISDLLSRYKNNKIKFSSMTRLSEHLAQEMSKELGTNIAGSTLRRNPQYKRLLIKYINGNKGIIKEQKDLVDMSIKIRNLKKVNEGLDREIKTLHNELAEYRHLMLETKNPPAAKIQDAKEFKKEKEVSQLKAELEAAYKLMMNLMELCTGFSSDVIKGTVTNTLNNETIMTKEQFPTFFKNLKSNFDC